MIEVKELSVSTEEKQILNGISYSFEPGKIYAVMGPNGSGKSTLAYSIMGHPGYEIQEGSQILMNGEDITEEGPDERAERGIFLSFQNPLALSGVRVFQLMQIAMNGKMEPLAIRNKVKEVAAELGIREDLLSRSLNEGASGGERKKMEVLQSAVLDKKFVLFDEVDTGVDVDALKTIAQYLDRNRGDKTYVLITHYNRILRYLKPDKVLVIANGKLQTVGDADLATTIENEGYSSVIGS